MKTQTIYKHKPEIGSLYFEIGNGNIYYCTIINISDDSIILEYYDIANDGYGNVYPLTDNVTNSNIYKIHRNYTIRKIDTNYYYKNLFLHDNCSDVCRGLKYVKCIYDNIKKDYVCCSNNDSIRRRKLIINFNT